MKASISINAVETRFNRTSLEKPWIWTVKIAGDTALKKLNASNTNLFHLAPAWSSISAMFSWPWKDGKSILLIRLCIFFLFKFTEVKLICCMEFRVGVCLALVCNTVYLTSADHTIHLNFDHNFLTKIGGFIERVDKFD